MSEESTMAVDSVDGTSYNQDEYELAIENGIEVTGYNSDAPVGEAEVQVTDEPKQELEIDESNESGDIQSPNQEATSEEVGEDPFGTPSDTSGEQVEEDDKNDEFKDMPKGFKKSLKRKERQVGRLERELAELKAQFNSQSQSTQQAQLPFNESQFASKGEYDSYKTAYEAATHAGKIQEQQAAQVRQSQDMAGSWNEKITSSFTSENEQAEYHETIQTLGNPAQHFSKEVLEYMFQSNAGPKMLQYFAERPQAIQQLRNMHAYDVPSVLTKVQSFVSQSVQQTTPKTSKAPTPVGSLTNKSNGVVAKSIDKMSDDELLKAYESGSIKF